MCVAGIGQLFRASLESLGKFTTRWLMFDGVSQKSEDEKKWPGETDYSLPSHLVPGSYDDAGDRWRSDRWTYLNEYNAIFCRHSIIGALDSAASTINYILPPPEPGG